MEFVINYDIIQLLPNKKYMVKCFEPDKQFSKMFPGLFEGNVGIIIQKFDEYNKCKDTFIDFTNKKVTLWCRHVVDIKFLLYTEPRIEFNITDLYRIHYDAQCKKWRAEDRNWGKMFCENIETMEEIITMCNRYYIDCEDYTYDEIGKEISTHLINDLKNIVMEYII